MCQVSCHLGSELEQFHFFHIMLTKASHKVGSHSKGRGRDFTCWQEELKYHNERSIDTERAELEPFLLSVYHIVYFIELLIEIHGHGKSDYIFFFMKISVNAYSLTKWLPLEYLDGMIQNVSRCVVTNMNGHKSLRSLNSVFLQVELLTLLATMHIELLRHFINNNCPFVSPVM